VIPLAEIECKVCKAPIVGIPQIACYKAGMGY
jgi:hypothetical protein